MSMFRFNFKPELVYTAEILQRMNTMIGIVITQSDSTLDETDVNYFKEYIDFSFNTIRFKLKYATKSNSTKNPTGVPAGQRSVEANMYSEKEVVKFTPPFSNVDVFTL